MPEEKTLILEIVRQPDALKMSVFEPKDAGSTLKQYSQHRIDYAEIEKLSREITAALNEGGFGDSALVRELQKTGQALWDHLLSRPVKERLKEAGPADLALTIDEELIDIPWELLYDGSNFLALKFNLGRLVRTKSSALSVSYRASAHIFKMLILADPTNDLKCAYREGLNIRDQFDRRRSSIHVDFKSTHIDRLYVKKNLSDYDIIHFAGHCEYDPHNQKNSGWLLSDGKFTIGDILNMGQASSLPALVFSNACHSAGSGLSALLDAQYQKKNYSLAAAFLFSGVRHYLGAIRKIEDSAGLAFAKEFYHHLILGRSVGESVRLARVKLVREYGIIALHWANYLLYGDPGFILFKPKVKPARPKTGLKIRFGKRSLAWFLAAAIGLGLGLYLYAALPTANPSAYRLFLRSQSAFSKGDNQQAIELAAQSLRKDPGLNDTYRVLADAYRRIGDKDNALKYYFEYTLLAEKRRDFKRLARGYTEIGWFYQSEGDHPKAFDFYHKALELTRRHKDKLNEAVAMRKLAVWYIDKQDYTQALGLLTKSAEINRERQHLYEHRYNLACDYFDLGLLFSDWDDFGAAKEFYRKSRAIFEKLKVKNELSDYYFNLGELYLFEKQYQKALDAYLSGLRLDQAQGNKLNLAGDYNMVGELYLEMERIPEAGHSFEEAIALSKEIRSQPELAAGYYNLGLLYKKLGQKKKAKEFLRLAQEIYSVIDPLLYQEVKAEILGLDKLAP